MSDDDRETTGSMWALYAGAVAIVAFGAVLGAAFGLAQLAAGQ